MPTCPLCDALLQEKDEEGWRCTCGELIPFGLERDDGGNCLACRVPNCPRRK